MATKIEPRTYAVKEADTGKLIALVDAFNNAQVFGHMARKAYVVEPASRQEMYEAGRAGVPIEQVSTLVDNQPELPIEG